MTIVSTVLVGVVLVIVAGLVILPLHWAFGQIKWLSERKHCQHAECGHQWTTAVSSEATAHCSGGYPCCSDCRRRHSTDDEQQYDCPRDGVKMNKVITNQIIRDVCPSCKFILLDEDELAAIEQAMYERGKLSGLAIGIATDIAVD